MASVAATTTTTTAAAAERKTEKTEKPEKKTEKKTKKPDKPAEKNGSLEQLASQPTIDFTGGKPGDIARGVVPDHTVGCSWQITDDSAVIYPNPASLARFTDEPELLRTFVKNLARIPCFAAIPEEMRFQYLQNEAKLGVGQNDMADDPKVKVRLLAIGSSRLAGAEETQLQKLLESKEGLPL